ncbi:MAG: helix-turn-helix domain-containing protein [bacterium]|nr:helix-turn-helix domain-containing protein [bacterium]
MNRTYVIPTSEKVTIENLYYKEKLSANEIATRINVSITTVYRFMRRHKIQRRTHKELSKLAFNKKPASYVLAPNQRTMQLKKLKTAGTIMYWCEGTTSEKATNVDFTNSKPEMIKLFTMYLRKICGINETKLRAMIYCHKNQDVAKITNFWSNLTGIPIDHFTKPYIRTDFDPNKIDKMPHGLVHIRYYDKKLLNQIREWIKEEAEQLTN